MKNQSGIRGPNASALTPGAPRTSILRALTACSLAVMTYHAAAQVVLYVDLDAPPGGDGLSWATAYNDLQDALDNANNDPGVDELWIAQGEYLPDRGTADPTLHFAIRPALDLYGGFVGDETSRDQRDPEANITVLSGAIDPGNDVHALQVIVVDQGAQTDTVIDGFTITQGFADGPRIDRTDSGAGIYADNAAPTVRHCRITDNTARFRGAGALTGGMNYHAVFDHCSFEHNVTTDALGLRGGAFAGSADFSDCRFADNTALDGGAVYCDQGINLDTCVFESNVAYERGGAIHVTGFADGTIVNCRFDSNQAAVQGGAISTITPELEIRGCTFVANHCDQDGGAFHAASFGNGAPPQDLDDCRFRGNTCDRDGAACFVSDPAAMRFIQCDLIGNSAQRDGGAVAGLAIGNFNMNLTFWNTTLAANTAAGDGGGIYVRGTRAGGEIANVILWDNTDASGSGEDSQVANVGGTVSFLYSDVQGWTGAHGGEGNFSADPLFVDLPGADQVIGTDDDNPRLGAGSPCIDAGDNDVLPPEVLADADGNPRYMDDPDVADTGRGTPPVIDLGPYEGEGQVFVMQAPTPGLAGKYNVFSVRGAPAHTTVTFVWGVRDGRLRVPGCPPGTNLGIRSPQAFGTAFASIRGNADFQMLVPAQASGVNLLFQAVQVDSCVVSDVLRFTFE